MKSRCFAGVALFAFLFAPAFAGAQQTPDAIFKKAIARATRAKTYTVHANVEFSNKEMGTVSMQVDYSSAGKKTRAVFTNLHGTSEQFQNVPDTFTFVSDGKKAYLTFQNAMALFDGAGADEPMVFLPDAKDLKDYKMILLAPQTLNGTAVDPIVLIDEDKVSRTYFIEEKTYRLAQLQVTDNTQDNTMSAKVVFTNEVLNPKFAPDTFKFVAPANEKRETIHGDASNPIAMALAVVASRQTK